MTEKEEKNSPSETHRSTFIASHCKHPSEQKHHSLALEIITHVEKKGSDKDFS